MGAYLSSMWFPRRCQHTTECSLTFSRSAREGREVPPVADEEAPHAAPPRLANMQWTLCVDPSGRLYMRNISNGYHTYQLQIPENVMNMSPVMTTFPVQDMDPTGLLDSPRFPSVNAHRTVRASFPAHDLPEPAAAIRIHEFEAIARHQQHQQQQPQQQQHHRYQHRYQRPQEQEDCWRHLGEADGD